MQVSDETIYRSLFLQARGVLKKALQAHLRTQHVLRGLGPANPVGHANDRNVLTISDRPAEAADQAIPGHWEADLLLGGQESQIAMLVERHSRFVMLVKLANEESDQLVKKLGEHVRKLPATLRRSVTSDRGTGTETRQRFAVAREVTVYFCDPHHPWLRGSNEAIGGLLRQYFPKGVDLSQFSQQHLDQVAKQLNQRPRQTLGFHNPADTLQGAIAATRAHTPD